MQTFLERKLVVGAGGGSKNGSSSRVAQEAPNTLRSRAIAKFVDLLSEGEIGGFLNGDKSVIFNKIPAVNPDGSSNFTGFNYKLLTGLSDQSYLEGFDQVTSEYSVGLRSRADGAAQWVTNGNNLDAVIATIQIPALTKQDKSNGDMNGYHVALAIDIRNVSTNGAWVQKVAYDHIQGKNTAPYERSYKITVDGPGQYAIRVRRLSADNDNDVSIQDKLYFQRVTEVIDQKLTYADSAVVGVSIDSEQFGTSIPQRAYEIYGMKCQYPSNYDPMTRTYSGFWNGTWSYGWCNNPAWVFRAMATHPRYGAGIPEQYVDKWGLYDLARYCDETVPDGMGGTEPRFVFNGTIASREQAYRVLQGIASMMRAIVFYAAGATIIRQDRPYRNEEIKSFTKANVLGSFNYSSTAKRARHTSANVQYVNPALGYEKDFVIYENPEGINRYGHNPLDIAAYGTTSRGQAYRLGKWAVLTDLLQTETVQFVVGVDGSDVLPGDIIEVADPHLATADFGGRIASISPDGYDIVLDRTIAFAGSTQPELHLTLVRGNLDDVKNPGGPEQSDRPFRRPLTHFSSPITSYDNVTKTVRLANPVPNWQNSTDTVPLVWVFSKDQLKPRLFKVFDVSERSGDGIEFKISAINFSAQKFLLMDENFNIESDGNNNYSDLPTTASCEPPSGLTFEYETYFKNGVATAGLRATWKPSPDKYLRGYVVSYRRNLDNWEDSDLQYDTEFSLEDVRPGVYDITVRAVNRFGARSLPISATKILNGDVSFGKALVSNILSTTGNLVFNGRDCQITWAAKPISLVSHGKRTDIRVIRPGVGEATNAATISGSNANPIISLNTIVGDQVEVNFDTDQFYVEHKPGQTTAQVAEVLRVAINSNLAYLAARSNNSVTVSFTDATLAEYLSAEDDPFFRRYVIQVKDVGSGNVIRTEYSKTPTFTYSYDTNVLDGGGIPRRSIRFDIAVEDIRGSLSAFSSAILTNPPPALTVPAVVEDALSFQLEFEYKATDADFEGIIVWVSDTPGVGITEANRRWKAPGNPRINGNMGKTYYFRYAFYDAFGEVGVTVSSEQQVTLRNFLLASDLAPGAPTAVLAAKTSEDMAAEMLRGALWREYTDGLLYIGGRDVGTVVQEAVEQFTDPEGSFVGSMQLLGGKNAAGTGFILNADTVFVSASPGESAVTSLRDIELRSDTSYQAVQRLDKVVEGFAETSTLVVVNDVVTGIRNTNDGSIGALTFQADVFSFVSRNGGQPRYPIRYGTDGILVLEDIVIQNANVLGDLIVGTRSIKDNNVTRVDSAKIPSPVQWSPNPQTVITYNINLDYPAKLIALATGSHDYYASGDPEYGFEISVDGTPIAFEGGANVRVTSLGTSGYANLAKGSHTVTVRWWAGVIGGQGVVRLSQANLIIMAAFK